MEEGGVLCLRGVTLRSELDRDSGLAKPRRAAGMELSQAAERLRKIIPASDE